MTDMLDLSTVQIVDSPADIAKWSVTTRIARLVMKPSGDPAPGLAFTFDAQARWPGVIPAGWGTPPSPADRVVVDPHVDGAIQYTVWALAKIGGGWVGAAFIQMWAGRPSTGAPILTDFAKNWAYADRWGALHGYQPQAGDEMGFFVSAGNARDGRSVTTVFERSNVVLVTLPAGDSGDFTFDVATVPVPAPPAPAPAPAPQPDPPAPELDPIGELLAASDRVYRGLQDVRQGIDLLMAKIAELEAKGVTTHVRF